MSNLVCASCGSTENVRQFQNVKACPDHTPAQLAGHPEPPVPDPESTMTGIMRAHGVTYDRALTPAGDTLVDARRREAGKKRTSPEAYRAARADVEDRKEIERARRTRATTGARDGATYTDFDYARLNGQAKRVFDVMADGKWRTLVELEEATGDPSPSIQARMRDFRKEKFGHLTMEAEETARAGVWRYRLVLPADVQMPLVTV